MSPWCLETLQPVGRLGQGLNSGRGRALALLSVASAGEELREGPGWEEEEEDPVLGAVRQRQRGRAKGDSRQNQEVIRLETHPGEGKH